MCSSFVSNRLVAPDRRIDQIRRPISKTATETAHRPLPGSCGFQHDLFPGEIGRLLSIFRLESVYLNAGGGMADRYAAPPKAHDAVFNYPTLAGGVQGGRSEPSE